MTRYFKNVNKGERVVYYLSIQPHLVNDGKYDVVQFHIPFDKPTKPIRFDIDERDFIMIEDTFVEISETSYSEILDLFKDLNSVLKR